MADFWKEENDFESEEKIKEEVLEDLDLLKKKFEYLKIRLDKQIEDGGEVMGPVHEQLFGTQKQKGLLATLDRDLKENSFVVYTELGRNMHLAMEKMYQFLLWQKRDKKFINELFYNNGLINVINNSFLMIEKLQKEIKELKEKNEELTRSNLNLNPDGRIPRERPMTDEDKNYFMMDVGSKYLHAIEKIRTERINKEETLRDMKLKIIELAGNSVQRQKIMNGLIDKLDKDYEFPFVRKPEPAPFNPTEGLALKEKAKPIGPVFLPPTPPKVISEKVEDKGLFGEKK